MYRLRVVEFLRIRYPVLQMFQIKMRLSQIKLLLLMTPEMMTCLFEN